MMIDAYLQALEADDVAANAVRDDWLAEYITDDEAMLVWLMLAGIEVGQ